MRVGVYFCNCGANIAERVDPEQAGRIVGKLPPVAFFKTCEYLCSEEGLEFLRQDLREQRPDRVVIAACSPRDYERTFRQVLSEAGLNPYLLQQVNIREQVAWVTPEADRALEKACAQIRAAVARVLRHEPLESKALEVCRDAVVIGAGPAGLKCALTLAEAGRRVTLVEKAALLGGLPVRYEELFPNLECGPCMLEPLLGEVLHGAHARNIEVLTLAEAVEVIGYFGNFTVKIRQAPRYVDAKRCIGCGLCIPPCPISAPNPYNCGMEERKAIALPFLGALPNAPFIDERLCLRQAGQDCRLCLEACPVEGAIRLDDRERLLERQAGAIVLAVGSSLYDPGRLPQLGYGQAPGVYTSLEFERLLASNGPTGGQLAGPGGCPPASVAFLHCAGSRDEAHRPYCSGVCCGYALKFNHLVRKKQPQAVLYHLYRELVTPGKEDFGLWQHVAHDPNSRLIRYRSLADISVSQDNGVKRVHFCDPEGRAASVAADMVVLCLALDAPEDSGKLGTALEAPRDRFGFFEELHGRMDSARSKLRGLYLAGACQAPMNIQQAISQGMAAAGYVLADLADGKQIELEPTVAWVDEERCAGCRTCRLVCPYKAISFDVDRRKAEVNALLCQGCGTCVAGCPAAALEARHFTTTQILAEIQAVLQ